MSTNVTLFAVDGPVVVYFQDGSSASMSAQEEKSFQLAEGGFCTISDSPAELDNEGEEHPPPGYAFAKAMIEFWHKVMDEIKEDYQEPEVNPL